MKWRALPTEIRVGIVALSILALCGAGWQAGAGAFQLLDSAGTNRASVNASGQLGTLDAATSATGSGVPAKGHFVAGITQTGTTQSAASGGNLTGVLLDEEGRTVTQPVAPRGGLFPISTEITSSTSSTSVVAAAGAGVFTDITAIWFVNTSAATNTLITLSDGTNSYYFYSVAGAPTTGVALPAPMPGASANTAWTVTCGTSTASIYVSGQYVKVK